MPNSAMLLKGQNQFSKKFVDKFCSPFFVLSITLYFNKKLYHTKLLRTTAPGCRAMNKAFTLALCELSLWLLASMEISKFVQFHGYLSSVTLGFQMDYPNTRLSWLTRQLDLELMFTSIISLRTANWIKWEKLFTDSVYSYQSY